MSKRLVNDTIEANWNYYKKQELLSLITMRDRIHRLLILTQQCGIPRTPPLHQDPFQRCTKAIILRSASTKKTTPSRSGIIIPSICTL
jgi:hypothetical protein